MSKYPAWKATRYAAHTAEKAITGLGRWATTDHTGTAKAGCLLVLWACWVDAAGV